MKYIAKIVLFALLLPVFASCNDWLNTAPEDGVIREEYWKTKEEVYAWLIGCYSAMIEDGMPEKMFLWGELRGETIMPNNIPSNYQAIMDGDITSTNNVTSWAGFYKVINQCNSLIAFSEKALQQDESFTQTMYDQYCAEAVALRSLMYFYLVRTFRDVPYTATGIYKDDQNLQLPKTDGSVILDSLVHSLELAIPKMAGRLSDDVRVNKGRFTSYAASALLADIYLWKEDYEGCVRNANIVMNSNQYNLLYGDGSHLREVEVINSLTGQTDTIYNVFESEANLWFQKLYVDGNCEESIFEIQREDDYYNEDFYALFHSSGAFYARMDALNDIYLLPSEVDNSWYDLRGEGYSYKSNLIWKHVGLAREGAALSNIRPREDMTSNFLVYRLSDVMLMKAEALNQQAKALEADTSAQALTEKVEKLEEAWDLIKQVRFRANATEATDLLYGSTSAQDIAPSVMEKFIYQERVREFLYEGKRWFDALRHAKRNGYEGENLQYLLDISIYGAAADKVANLQAKYQNKDFHYLPINESEIRANKKLIQNPFYQ